MPCAGWAGEACGGSQRITVYETLDANPPSTNPGVPGFPLLGCYTEPVGARALPVRAVYEGGLTVAKCTAVCAKRGFALAGVEYGRGALHLASFAVNSLTQAQNASAATR